MDAKRLERAIARIRNSDAAVSWIRSVGLSAEFCQRAGIGLERERDRQLDLVHLLRRRDGGRALQELRLLHSGELVGAAPVRPSLHWSSPPCPGAHLVVAPDMVTFWLLEARLGLSGIAPFTLVTRSHDAGMPIEWSDPAFWDAFGEITLLLDRPARGDGILTFAAAAHDVDVGVLPAPHRSTWREFLANSLAFDRAELREMVDQAADLSSYLSNAGSANDVQRADFRIVSIHDLDENGRMTRLLRLEQSATVERSGRTFIEHRLCDFIVRSDRRMLELAPLPAPPGTAPAHRLSALVDGTRIDRPPAGGVSDWGIASVEAFLAGTGAVDEARLFDELVSRLREETGLDRDLLIFPAAFVMMTFVYQLFAVVPPLVIEGGPLMTRQRLARIVTALSHGGLLVSRSRARELARLADRSGGGMVIDEPGTLMGALGPTEIGRFVLSSTQPGMSTEHLYDERDGTRTLRTFGPRMVVRSHPAPLSVCDGEIVVSLDGCALASTGRLQSPGALGGLKDDLYTWAMAAVANGTFGSAPISLSSSYDQLFAIFGVDPSPPAPASASSIAAVEDGGNILKEALDACRRVSGQSVSIAQLSLEASMRGGTGDGFSPERIGRWLMASGELDTTIPVSRRRLHGQVVRIYRLRSLPGDTPRLEDPFDFCTRRGCGDCPYANVCEDVLPGLRRKKLGRT